MLTQNDPISFLATRDAVASRSFYEQVLGLQLVADEPFALVFNLNGHMLRIARSNELVPARHTVLGWHVDDIEAKVKDLQGRGVTFTRFEGLPQDGLGIWQSPSGARIAWFRDPDGNNLSLTEFPG